MIPEVKIGDTVHVFHAGDVHSTPFVMIVTKVGDLAIGGNVITPDNHNFRLERGVRHVSNKGESGSISEFKWDHTPETYELLAAKELLRDLQGRFDSLRDRCEEVLGMLK